MAIVAVVALFVVGPERLPGLVRATGYWFGKIRYWVNSTNSEMKREFRNAEILQREATEKLTQTETASEQLNIQQPPAEKSTTDEKQPPKTL